MTDPEHIKSSIQKLQDNLAQNLFSMTKTEALEKGICIRCKCEALPKCYSAAGRKEYTLSALCEPCFDEITGG